MSLAFARCVSAHPNAVRWEAVEAIPGQVAVTPSQLLAAALRHRPDRIVMGEIRDECGYDLLQAMNTGHGGTPRLNRSAAVGVLTNRNMGTKISFFTASKNYFPPLSLLL